MNSSKILEIACFNLESALIAQSSGADRIELCEDYKLGGISPTLNNIFIAREKIRLPLHVIIRPKPDEFGKEFVISPPEEFKYSEMEIQWMIQFILGCRFGGIDGIVFGALNDRKEIDVPVVKRLIEAADTMSLTFHRAIDQCNDIDRSIRQLIDLGINRILTSGGPGSASDNILSLKKLQNNFGNNITIIPGGGIRSSNLKEIMQSDCTEFHSAAITAGAEMTDAKEVAALKQLLTQPL